MIIFKKRNIYSSFYSTEVCPESSESPLNHSIRNSCTTGKDTSDCKSEIYQMYQTYGRQGVKHNRLSRMESDSQESLLWKPMNPVSYFNHSCMKFLAQWQSIPLPEPRVYSRQTSWNITELCSLSSLFSCHWRHSPIINYCFSTQEMSMAKSRVAADMPTNWAVCPKKHIR